MSGLAACLSLAKAATAPHLHPMSKRLNKTGRDARTGKISGQPKRLDDAKVLGRTSDGVYILKPKGKATHFTQKELREAVESARAARRT